MAVKIVKKKVPFSGVYDKKEAIKYFNPVDGMLKYITAATSGYGEALWLDRSSGELV